MATPASRATSVMVGPEWRRLAAFRGAGTNDPSYVLPVFTGNRRCPNKSVSPGCPA